VLNIIASYEKREQVQQANVFKRQTLTFHFSTYWPTSLKYLSHHTPVRLYERIECCDHCIGGQNKMATSHSSSTILSGPLANFLHQTCTAVLIQYLSRYIGRISGWMEYALNAFPHRKRITECCSLRDAFSGNAAISNDYKWRHSDITTIKLTAGTQIESPTKHIFRNFQILKSNRMTPFYNLFMERPWYIWHYNATSLQQTTVQIFCYVCPCKNILRGCLASGQK